VHTVPGGGGLAATVDVEHGARITGLVSGGREWLAPSLPLPAGAPRAFVHAGTGGWDDAIPTVAACVLADGKSLPDHGDVWDLRWEVVEASVESLLVRVALTSLPIELERRISPTRDGLRIDWTASTEFPVPVSFLWSAHPLFVAEPGSRMVAPGALVEEYPGRGPVEWPESIDSIEDGRALKAFAPSGGIASIVQTDGSALTLTWDPAVLPHLGLYWDRGEFSTRPVMAIEPTMAPTDSAARAEALWTITAGEPRRWWVEVRPGVPT